MTKYIITYIVTVFHLLTVCFVDTGEVLLENLSGLRIIASKPQDETGVIMEKLYSAGNLWRFYYMRYNCNCLANR